MASDQVIRLVWDWINGVFTNGGWNKWQEPLPIWKDSSVYSAFWEWKHSGVHSKIGTQLHNLEELDCWDSGGNPTLDESLHLESYFSNQNTLKRLQHPTPPSAHAPYRSKVRSCRQKLNRACTVARLQGYDKPCKSARPAKPGLYSCAHVNSCIWRFIPLKSNLHRRRSGSLERVVGKKAKKWGAEWSLCPILWNDLTDGGVAS